jgi:hypothetical protein
MIDRIQTVWLAFLTMIPLQASESPDFSRQILPLLSENCFQCHGPDAERREADLALHDQREAMRVITAGARGESELYARITSTEADLQMPPPDSGHVLTADQQELIGAWIDAGAEWNQHWSWQAVQRPKIPQVAATSGAVIRNPIDAFIQSRLQQSPLQASEEADRRTLIRRLSLDLRGLPPNAREIAAFLADTEEGAYERLVEQLLESPSFGVWRGTGWMPPGMQTAMAIRGTRSGQCGRGETGLSRPSIRICHLTSSLNGSWPETCFPNPGLNRSLPPGSAGII